MLSSTNVEPLLGVEGNALCNSAEVTAELSKDIANLIGVICLLHNPQVDITIGRVTGGREGERRKKD